MRDKIKELGQRKKEIVERIRKTKELKRKVVDEAQRLVSQYNSEKICSFEYKDKLNRIFKKKTPQQWVDYYDQGLKVYNSHLNDCEKKIIEKRRSSIKKVEVVLIVFCVLAILFVSFYPKDLILFAPPTGTYTQTLNLTVTENMTYTWNLENLGSLQLVSISGLIEGEGEVKIYLEDFLILDSDNLPLLLLSPEENITLPEEEVIPPEENVTEEILEENITLLEEETLPPEENITETPEENITIPGRSILFVARFPLLSVSIAR